MYTKSDITKKLQEKFPEIKNPFALPKLEKVAINMRVAEARENQAVLDAAAAELAAIVGQKPKICRAKKSISGFKLRQNDPLALKVTLRGKRMFDFVERLFNLVMPRLRDFKGLPQSSFDGGGNFNIGLKDHTVFPEIDVNKVGKGRGMQITLVTKAKNQEEAKVLLEVLGLPLSKVKN